jgi:hypothetical protein
LFNRGKSDLITKLRQKEMIKDSYGLNVFKSRVLEEIYKEISDIQKNKLNSYSTDSATIELQESVESICQAIRDIIEIVDSNQVSKPTSNNN